MDYLDKENVTDTNIESKTDLDPFQDDAEIPEDVRQGQSSEFVPVASERSTSAATAGTSRDTKRVKKPKRRKKDNEIPLRKLTKNRTYDITIQDIDSTGIFTCLDLDTDVKKYQEDLQEEIDKFYALKQARDHFRVKNKMDLKPGKVVIAPLKKVEWSVGPEGNRIATKTYHWMRAKVKSFEADTKTAIVTCVDDFNEFEANVNHLCRPSPRFLELPAALVRCRVADLEMLDETDVISKVMEECPLDEPVLYFLVWRGKYSKHGRFPLVEITWATAEDDNEMTNAKDLNNLQEYILNRLSSVISPLGSLVEDRKVCRIVNCDDEGYIWIRFQHDDYVWNRMNSLFKDMALTFNEIQMEYPIETDLLRECPEKSMEMMYVTVFEYFENEEVVSELRRIYLLEILSNNQVSVFYIDYGFSDVIPAPWICSLEIFYPSLTFLPPMVVKCHLEGIDHMTATLEDIKAISPFPSLHAKLMDEWPEDVRPPDVRIWLSKNDMARYEEGIETAEQEYQQSLPPRDIPPGSLSGLLISKGLAVPMTEKQIEKIKNMKHQYTKKVQEKGKVVQFQDQCDW